MSRENPSPKHRLERGRARRSTAARPPRVIKEAPYDFDGPPALYPAHTWPCPATGKETKESPRNESGVVVASAPL
ncbi:hypothetical protein MTO96_022614 [Rhipicephalus appendiculatus]